MSYSLFKEKPISADSITTSHLVVIFPNQQVIKVSHPNTLINYLNIKLPKSISKVHKTEEMADQHL